MAREDPNRAAYLGSLASALGLRFLRHGLPADLDEAIKVGRQAVSLTPASHPNGSVFRSNLATLLLRRFDRCEQPTDLDEAIELRRQVVASTTPDHPSWAGFRNNLADALATRFGCTGQLQDLDEAIEIVRPAVEAPWVLDPQRATCLLTLSTVLSSRFSRTGRRPDADAAMELCRRAANTGAAPVRQRLAAARLWGLIAATLGDRWAMALEGYEIAVSLLPLLVWRGLDRWDSEHLLREVSVAGAAAATAVLAELPERAVELLEQGRAVLWSQLLDTRVELSILRELAPELAGKLDRVRAELNYDGSLEASGVV